MKFVLVALIFVSLQRESFQYAYDYNRPSAYGATHLRYPPAVPAPAPAPAYPSVYTMDVPVIYTNSEGKLVTGTKSVLVTDYSSGAKNGMIAAKDYTGVSNWEYRRPPTSDYYGRVRMPPENGIDTTAGYGGNFVSENRISTSGHGISTSGHGISTSGYGNSTPGYGNSTPGYGNSLTPTDNRGAKPVDESLSPQNNDDDGAWRSTLGHVNRTSGFRNSLTSADNRGAKPVDESLSPQNNDDGGSRRSQVGHANKTTGYGNNLTPAADNNSDSKPANESLSQNNQGAGARRSKIRNSNRTTDYENSLTTADNSGVEPVHESLSQNDDGGSRRSMLSYSNKTPPIPQRYSRYKSRTAPHNSRQSSSWRTKPVGRRKSRNSGSVTTIHPLLANIKDENTPVDLELSANNGSDTVVHSSSPPNTNLTNTPVDLKLSANNGSDTVVRSSLVNTNRLNTPVGRNWSADNGSDTVVRSSLPNTNRPKTPIGRNWSADNGTDTVVRSSLVNTNSANTPVGRSLSQHIESATTTDHEEITITPSNTSLFKPENNPKSAVHQGTSTYEESSSHVLDFLSKDDKNITPVSNVIRITLPDKLADVQEYSNTHPAVTDHHWNPNTLESLFQKMKSMAEQTSNDSSEPSDTAITAPRMVIDDSNPVIYKRRIVKKSTSLQRSAAV